MAFILNQNNISKIKNTDSRLPEPENFELPERVIQFGTGVLLRGLPDYFIDKANKSGIFNGRVLVVKSTSSGTTDHFSTQNGLYTICIKGLEKGKNVEEDIINSSISRVVSAQQSWKDILAAAHQSELQIVISNTTEVGIVDSNDLIIDNPPKSYPGKLLAFLYERFKAFQGSTNSGMVILPTELISNNAEVLKQVLLKLTELNKLDNQFRKWLLEENYFCNTLVDRIVPGGLSNEDNQLLADNYGYEDQLAIMVEPFSLWAIESNSQHVKDVLSFANADKGVLIVPSIDKFKELKLRLLNGTHTLICALAILAGFDTVKVAMENADFKNHVVKLMEDEIAPVIEGNDISQADISEFAESVIDRFSNPFLAHQWKSITLNYTSKLKLRNIPLIAKYYSTKKGSQERTALGFAAFILLMKSEKRNDDYFVNADRAEFKIQDISASTLFEYWKNPETVVKQTLSDVNLWGENLNDLLDFSDAVEESLNLLQNVGATKVLADLNA